MSALAAWRRRGSEAQSEDARLGHVGHLSREELEELLEDCFEADLAALPEGEREAALAALVVGYTEGG